MRGVIAINFKQRLNKRSHPTTKKFDVGCVQRVKKGYKIQIFMSLRCFFAKTNDVLKIKKHQMGHGAEVVIKNKNYDFI